MDENRSHTAPAAATTPHLTGRPETAGASQGRQSEFAVRAPSVSLPKGGGALRGIGERFSVSPSTGTAGLQVPIAAPSGRAGSGPHLALSYDSGSGNGPFGLGWSLELPAITRKTDKGLPRYVDSEDSDVFVLSGAEDLVPVLEMRDRHWQPASRDPTEDGVTYRVRRYRPRTEGLFARIERWTDTATGDTHWRTTSRDNVTTVYGRTNNSRVFDPAEVGEHPHRVFSWLICQTRDDRGNVVEYGYKGEDPAGVDRTAPHERDRGADSRTAQRYIKHIRYGNTIAGDWMFRVVFDYGEHHATDPKPGDNGDWLCRYDPFSSCRAGFETRTYRLCQRILIYHNFPDRLSAGADCLVRSLDLAYHNPHGDPDGARRGDRVVSLLASVTQCGYRRGARGLLRKPLPPLEFDYSSARIDTTVRSLPADSLTNLPQGVDGSAYQWVDLDGEGVSGVLAEAAGAWFFKPNNGNGQLGPTELVATIPAGTAGPGAGGGQLLDLAGDGALDLVTFGGSTPGYFERTADRGWEPLRAFTHLPRIGWDQPNLRFVDLDGDGHADVMCAEADAITWWPSEGEAGFGPATRVPTPTDEALGARVVFGDGEHAGYLADMSGDGMTDLVRVGNGEICYWPNLGYGRFGPRVVMDNAPLLDRPGQFDHRRVRLTDIDGSGTHDLIYVGAGGPRAYRNQAGNAWSEPVALPAFPTHEDVSTVDLLGAGTACLVWCTPLPGHTRDPIRYLDLMADGKPYLLTGVRNNLGAETVIAYTTSTACYLDDKAAGRPWVTRLAFPVHVVSRVETLDHVSRNRFVTRYAYHHGYFDGEEREFRGFGMVEQWDTEELGVLGDADRPPSAAGWQAANWDAASHVPPVLTRTWYHTGAFVDGRQVSEFFAREYYREGDASDKLAGLSDAQAATMVLADTTRPADPMPVTGTVPPVAVPVTAALAREACRALKGSVLRQEVYGQDGTDAADRPYTTAERSYSVELLQPAESQRHAVFFAHPRESLTFHLERRLTTVDGRLVADPRVGHEVVLSVDAFGNELQSVSIGYGRRHADPDPRLTEEDRARQRRAHVTYTRNDYTRAVDTDVAYRTPLLWQTRTFELPDLAAPDAGPAVTALFRFADLADAVAHAGDGGHDVPYEDLDASTAEGAGPHRRLIEHVRHRFRPDELGPPLEWGMIDPLALPYQSYQLAFTPGLLTSAFDVDGFPADPAALMAEGGYVRLDGVAGWWIPSGRILHSPGADDTDADELAWARRHFWLPYRFVDPFGKAATVTYDDPYQLLVTRVVDPVGNTVSAAYDYRVLQPRQVTDPNGNRSTAAFDALGLVAGTAVAGKVDDDVGDRLDETFEPDLPDEVVRGHLADPLADPLGVLGTASTRLIYDLSAYRRSLAQPGADAVPCAVLSIARETHARGPGATATPRVQLTVAYSDGFGREIQHKTRAESGPLVPGGPDVTPRWVGSGWTVFNNKGKPVRRYEPFFTGAPAFEFNRREGVSPVLCYDPVERVVATLHPDHTYGKVVYDPWRQETWDATDTVRIPDPKDDPDVGGHLSRLRRDEYRPTWFAARIGGVDDDAREAAAQAEAHHDTPTRTYADALGRTFLTVAHNRFARDGQTVEEFYAERVALDIEGNQRSIVDALDRVVVRYEYDMLGHRVREASMEAGRRWTLTDVAGHPVRRWDSLRRSVRTRYDDLRRPVQDLLTEPGRPEKLVSRTVYGEDAPTPELNNLRGRAYQVYDGAGVLTSQAFDFKGNPTSGTRQLTVDYKSVPDWAGEVPLDGDVFATRTSYDALSRPVAVTTPDATVLRPGYNEAGLLERVEGDLRGVTPTVFVSNIDYDARGQRARILYARADVHPSTPEPAARTEYEYDRHTFRLRRLRTFRGGDVLQDLTYTYDPVGNVTRIRDAAQPAIFFRNDVVEATTSYSYDAVSRLVQADGREHLGQAADGRRLPPTATSFRDAPRVGLLHPSDGRAMGRYRETFAYDGAGNILALVHASTDPQNDGWTRTFDHHERSQPLVGTLEPDAFSNRLSASQVNGDATQRYGYDPHGNMTTLAPLSLVRWDYRDRLQATAVQVRETETAETTYYGYDATGQRVRKVTESQAGPGQQPVRVQERIYLGGVEYFRKYGADGVTVSLERQTLHVSAGKRRVALVESTAGVDLAPERLVRYQLGNHLGSACLELDGQGQVISYEEYHPYGSTAYQAVRGTVRTPKRYRYTGRERDEETGLAYHGARYYAPWLGRWTSCDPQGLADGLNRYSYARGSPINLNDPHGTQSTRPDLPDVRLPRPAALDTRSAEERFKHGAILSLQERAAVYAGMKPVARIKPVPSLADIPMPDIRRPPPGPVDTRSARPGPADTQPGSTGTDPVADPSLQRPTGSDPNNDPSIWRGKGEPAPPAGADESSVMDHPAVAGIVDKATDALGRVAERDVRKMTLASWFVGVPIALGVVVGAVAGAQSDKDVRQGAFDPRRKLTLKFSGKVKLELTGFGIAAPTPADPNVLQLPTDKLKDNTMGPPGPPDFTSRGTGGYFNLEIIF